MPASLSKTPSFQPEADPKASSQSSSLQERRSSSMSRHSTAAKISGARMPKNSVQSAGTATRLLRLGYAISLIGAIVPPTDQSWGRNSWLLVEAPSRVLGVRTLSFPFPWHAEVVNVGLILTGSVLKEQFASTLALYTAVRMVQAFERCEESDKQPWTEELHIVCSPANGAKVLMMPDTGTKRVDAFEDRGF